MPYELDLRVDFLLVLPDSSTSASKSSALPLPWIIQHGHSPSWLALSSGSCVQCRTTGSFWCKKFFCMRGLAGLQHCLLLNAVSCGVYSFFLLPLVMIQWYFRLPSPSLNLAAPINDKFKEICNPLGVLENSGSLDFSESVSVQSTSLICRPVVRLVLHKIYDILF